MISKYRDYLIIAGVVTVLLVLILPGKKNNNHASMPDAADAKDVDKTKNAGIALTAYMDAYQDGKPADFLNNLAATIQKKYQIRVSQVGANKFVASDLRGNVILESAM